jgi:hypothetical protein
MMGLSLFGRRCDARDGARIAPHISSFTKGKNEETSGKQGADRRPKHGKEKMKKLLAAAAISAALVSTASADIRTYYRSGAWENYAGTSDQGRPMCGMSISKRDVSMALHIKWLPGIIRVMAFKKSWNIPEGTQVPVELGFDSNFFGTTTATGGMFKTGTAFQAGTVTFDIAATAIDHFLEEVGGSNKMWLKFTNGNEVPWSADMTGSRNSVNSFKYCISEMLKRNGSATQPYSSSSTQPYSSTQPFDQTAPIAPKSISPVPVTPKRSLKPYESGI